MVHALAWPIEPERRHLVVAFTDGYDTQSILETERLPALARHSDAVLHAVFWMMPARTGGGGGWQVPRVKAGGWHKLEVKIAQPGSFTIRARKGYEG